eukprot:5669218-Pyramimonas_sp.AAC.1
MNASPGRNSFSAHPGADSSDEPLSRPEGIRTLTRKIRSSSDSEPAAATDEHRDPCGDDLGYDPEKVSEESEGDVADEPEGNPATGEGHNTETADDETSS